MGVYPESTDPINMYHQPISDRNNSPTLASTPLTLLFGPHATADDIAWRVDQIERAIRRHPHATRHLVLIECNVPSTLPSTVGELQEMYDQASSQFPELPPIEWGPVIRTDSMSDAQRQILMNLHGAGIAELVNRCDACPDGSHELQGRPEWMPVSHLITSLRNEGLNVKCGPELFSFESFVLALRHGQLFEDANAAGREGNLSKLFDVLLIENGLRWKSDRARDRHLVEVIAGFHRQNPEAHIVVERGSAHRSSLEIHLRLTGLKFDSLTLEISGRTYLEIEQPDFWKDADSSPTQIQLAQAIREATISLSQLSDPRQEEHLAERLASVPHEHMLEVSQAAVGVRLEGVDAMKSHIFKQLAARGHEILIQI